MLEMQHTETHQEQQNAVKTISSIQNASRVSSYANVESRSHDVLHRGNHVTALPYWSLSSQLDKTDVVGYLEAYNGIIYPYEGGRQATFHDWPWASSGKPFGHYYVNRVTQCQLTFNVTRLVTHPVLKLPTGTEAEWETLRRLADTKALGNVRKALANLPLIMAERRETLSMIGGKVTSMIKGAKALQQRSLDEYRKTKPKNRRAVAQRISGEHLEFVFGWLPAISEIEGLVEFLHKDKLDFIRSRGVKGFRTTKPVSSDAWIEPMFRAGYFGQTTFGVIETRGEETTSIGVRTALRYKLSSQIVGDAYALGFDPVGSAFDFIPLSFISGWVTNFDYWIRTLTPTFGLEFETGSRNSRRIHAFDVKGSYARRPRSDYDVVGTVPPSHVSGRTQRDDRVPLLAEPSSSFEIDVEVGLYEVAAGISLTLQRFYKPLKRNLALKPFRYEGPRPKWLKEIRYTGRR